MEVPSPNHWVTPKARAHHYYDSYKKDLHKYGRDSMVMLVSRSPIKMCKIQWHIRLVLTSYVARTLELQKLFTKVLSLPFSSSGCEENWSMFRQVRTKKKDLVY